MTVVSGYTFTQLIPDYVDWERYKLGIVIIIKVCIIYNTPIKTIPSLVKYTKYYIRTREYVTETNASVFCV